MTWALQEINLAHADTGESRMRQATQAVGNARKALDCLVDWYLRRDGFAYCGDVRTRSDSRSKSKLLRERGILDSLTERVLARAIDVRNEAEHEFVGIDLHQAEDVVELFRRTAQGIMLQSDPSKGFGVLGSVGHGTGINEKSGVSAWFYGWTEPIVVFGFSKPDPTLDVVLPSSTIDAVVRRLPMSEIKTELWADALRLLESKYGTVKSSSASPIVLESLFTALGLA